MQQLDDDMARNTVGTDAWRQDLQDLVRAWIDAHSHPTGSVADLLCDRRDGATTALRYEDARGHRQTFTFADLRAHSARFACVLRDVGVARGDRVATLLPKGPELVITTLALWRLGAVHVPLFTAFGPQAIAYRVSKSEARVIVTDAGNRAKLDGMADGTATVDTARVRVVTVAGPGGVPPRSGDVPFWNALTAAEPLAESLTASGEDLFILLYTSGTTGQPKGVEVPVKALAAFEAYMRFGLDLRDDDVFWNIADPGWAYGLYYGLIGPLLLGCATLMVQAPFDAEATYRLLEAYGVTNFAAAPTVYRALRAHGAPAGLAARLRLRVLSSAGEPLNPDVVEWAREHLGVPIHDHYGQTELGMVVNNHHAPALQRPLRRGSMGQAMPGFRMVIVDAEGAELPASTEGQLAVDMEQSPLCWFRGYYRDAERTAERFPAGRRYNYTSDAASRDDEGYIYFSGRSDDVITCAGYRIGPFEVESALMRHPAVAEAAAVGVPDALRGEVVKAYVVLRTRYAPTAALAEELGSFVKRNLSAHAYPRAIAFVEALPKTPSGKVQRFLLRQQ
jgi:acetyl-CoA synthetase